jgi:drug/metabolite transporter (DMT)-like permease
LKNIILFILPALIWGSTWLVIKFQLGVVDPIVSVVYRFFLASTLLFAFCKIRGLNLNFKSKDHLYIALQGFFLFGFNYWLVYVAEQTLASGLVAVLFSLIIFLNIFIGFLFLRTPIRKPVLLGGVVGILGTLIVFHEDVFAFSFSNKTSVAFLLGLLAVLSASFGNIISARNQKNKLPVIQTNAFGMFYGALSMLVVSIGMGSTFNFDTSSSYILSMIYLIIFGSIVAFTSYLKLLGNIGADKSAYVTLVIPIIALILSSIFEGYMWNSYAIIGVSLILLGNGIILRKKNKQPASNV